MKIINIEPGIARMNYNAKTGWTRCRQWHNYLANVDGQSNNIEERLEALEKDFYWDVFGNIHVRCLPGELWTILSGEADSFYTDYSHPQPSETEWIRMTDLGAVFDPVASTSTIQKLLREEGLLKRVNGTIKPTSAAKGLFIEREPISASRIPKREGAVQRLWSYEVVKFLRARREEVEPELTARRDKRLADETAKMKMYRKMTLKFEGKCAKCGLKLKAGNEGYWRPLDRKCLCVECGKKE